MSSSLVALLLDQLRSWLESTLLPLLRLSWKTAATGFLQGSLDTLLLAVIGAGVVAGGRLYMGSEYALPQNLQEQVLKWTPIADEIARTADIPREVPLVLWYKENSMLAVNPDNCTGIMGTYDLVRSGARSCFTPGKISDLEVVEQLSLGAREFKKRCPDIEYTTQDPAVIKRCYFAYNAGVGAASRQNPDRSAYVMNQYDAAHRDMVYSDIELGTVRSQQLGAWPTHLAMQSLIVSHFDAVKPTSAALIDVSTRVYDAIAYFLNVVRGLQFSNESLVFPGRRDAEALSCLATPHRVGRPGLRPHLNPVTVAPILTQDVHGCSYNLPGIDISSSDSSAILQAPMPGKVTIYTDQWHNTTVRIENDEWIVWLLHPRSYLVREGSVRAGQPVAVMGAVGFATGPHVHYTILDKATDRFVDPRLFLP